MLQKERRAHRHITSLQIIILGFFSVIILGTLLLTLPFALRNAATIMLMYIVLFLSGGMIISRTENIGLVPALFETASAIGTVGLSLGVTPELGIFSQMILICLMFFGRVGGLTLIFAATSEKRTAVSKYPQEKITVG